MAVPERLRPTRSWGPGDVRTGKLGCDPTERQMVNPDEKPKRRIWTGKRGPGRPRKNGGFSTLQQAMPMEGLPERTPPRSKEERAAAQKRHEDYLARYQPEPGHEGESPEAAWRHRKITPKLPKKEYPPPHLDGEAIEWGIGGDMLLMDIPDAGFGELNLTVPDELRDWWWSEGWGEARRSDGSVVWPGIQHDRIVRKQLNPLMPDATCRARLMNLPLMEWPAKPALAWTLWASHSDNLSYTEMLESVRDKLWPNRELLEAVIGAGYLPMPLVNLTRLPRSQVEQMLPTSGASDLRKLWEEAEEIGPKPGELLWLAVEISHVVKDDGWRESRPVEAVKKERPADLKGPIPSRPAMLWINSILGNLGNIFPKHFPDHPSGWHETLLLPEK